MEKSRKINPLGREVGYDARYNPECLFPVPRKENREKIGIPGALPFAGTDIWNAYELSWLNMRGKPLVAMAEIRFPAETQNIVESKSLKLYLNSFNQTPFEDPAAVRDTMEKDLGDAARGAVTVSLTLPDDFNRVPFGEPEGILIDSLDVDVDQYRPAPDLLSASDKRVSERLVSNLLRSNCPVTGQPDWATVIVGYTGGRIDRAGLLRYIVSFREHTGFHENCVEQIFMDITARCRPESLSVYARFTRRGGIDINPFRSTPAAGGGFSFPGNERCARQ